jgi:Fe-S oxidoreductase
MFHPHNMPRSKPMPRRAPRLIVVALASAVACVAVAACGSSTPTKKLNNATIASSIARSILVEHHLGTKVTCPANVAEQQGTNFNCYAKLDVGRYRVPVTQVNSRGDVKWHTTQPITVLNIVRVERAIASSIKKQRKVRAKVRCPKQVLQAAGLKFTCIATTRGGKKVHAGRYPFRVTETDSAGHVTYIAG